MMQLAVLQKYVKAKKLRRADHPEYRLSIWNYTDQVQFKKQWDDVTRVCRGLVTDDTGAIVARAFPKFFNFEEVETPTGPYEVFEKIDGSLGILFYYATAKEWLFASRGSFTSPQAEKGREILLREHANVLCALDKNLSYLFEIVYPENRIVVDYGATEDLVYLSSYTVDGTERPQREAVTALGFVVATACVNATLVALKARDTTNAEGFVVRYATGERLKIKFDTYFRTHKQISSLSVKEVYKWIRRGDSEAQIYAEVPDECHEWLRNVLAAIEDDMNTNRINLDMRWEPRFKGMSRAAFATHVPDGPLKAIMFAAYDGDAHRAILDRVDVKAIAKRFPARLSYVMTPKPPQRAPELFFTVGEPGALEWASSHVALHRDTTVVGPIQVPGALETVVTMALDAGLSVVVTDPGAKPRAFMSRGVAITTVHFPGGDKRVVCGPGTTPTVERDPSLPRAYVFDLDGTLALNTSGRSYYDMRRVGEDDVNDDVARVCRELAATHTIVLCSGRSESAREKTIEWCAKHDIVARGGLYLRPKGDNRKDFVVKEELWRSIARTYQIMGVFEDRQAVVDHGRRLGLTVFQVQNT